MFKKVLIANRGAIAVRIERTLKAMGIKSVAVYSKADQDSLHVENADEAVFLGEGSANETYLDAKKILDAAIKTKAEAIHPGYGFLSENTEFSRECENHGIKFIGPTAEQIELFGLKHSARELAIKAKVPLLPGTGLLTGLDEAVKEGKKIGYPVILKSTAGGGGIGMRICNSEEELINAYEAVCHLAEANFNNSGVFLEKYIVKSRHIEVQIFGNSFGEVVTLGERDCSVQRRNQKVVEESPAPNLTDKVRKEMYEAAERLAKVASYRSAGTVEFLYDENTEEFFFLEVNTRLQVEHGITEEVFGVDLVSWMVNEAADDLEGLKELVKKPEGHAIEVRVYAEDCLNGFRPSTGKIDDVIFSNKARVETWIQKGVEVSSLYDPMIAKIIVHGQDRKDAVEKMREVLSKSRVYGITTNMEYLKALFDSKSYKEGNLFTAMLRDFHPEEYAIEVLDGGVQTTVQDYPGMIGYWSVGVPPCGPMDNYNFRLGNSLLGNREDAPGLELTLRGGTYKFRTAVSFCITGADMNATLDGEPVPRYRVNCAMANQVLKFKDCKVGMRAYLLVAGGFDIPKIMGSSSTFIDGKFGGHGGRTLRGGDVLMVTENCLVDSIASIPNKYWPEISNSWTIGVIPGPQPTSEYLKEEYLHTLTNTEYEVNFNSARTGIRLNGPIPQWVREDGGEAGLHPSNIHDNAYAIGTLDLTGDQAVLLGPDGPSLGGFVCPVTTAKGELWKLGQLHSGDKVSFKLLTLEEAEVIRKLQEENLKNQYSVIKLPKDVSNISANYAVLAKEEIQGTEIQIRLAGEENILVEYGEMELNIESRFRVHILMQQLEKTSLPIIDLTPGIRSLQIHFDVSKINAIEIAKIVIDINRKLSELKDITVPSRIIKLPLSWDDPQTQLAAKRYQETVRENAPWCPSNPEFIRRINGLDSIEEVKDIVFDAEYLVLGLGDVYLGAPVATPIDPRHRMVTTKYNPARPWTPENAVGIGGAYLCVYGMEGPGGYQFVGRTVQMWNQLKVTKSFKKGKPWLLNFFDRLKFYPVTAEEILKLREDFLRGKFEVEIEETTFNLGEYEKFLEENKESIKTFKDKQEAAFEAERQRWKDEGLDEFISELNEPVTICDEEIAEGCEAVLTNIPGGVWKILVKEGDEVKAGEEIIILESMKMEFPITAEYSGTIEKIYITVGDQLNAGHLVASIRVKE
ncbi:Urea amidolyase [Clostridium bornimense]|uniref:Urea amidolyase n=1 Tax=Clostridium bornimense TaxID=1216932 RepID=W6S2Z8_9CLOT|nr:urea carboxylase [Clostridium bornimense]CDM70289.1 Urea amidolyase [Clostridium bornimense]